MTDTGHVIATGTTNNYKISGLITGTGNLTKTGTNAVTMTAANTYKGGTTGQRRNAVGRQPTGSGLEIEAPER